MCCPMSRFVLSHAPTRAPLRPDSRKWRGLVRGWWRGWPPVTSAACRLPAPPRSATGRHVATGRRRAGESAAPLFRDIASYVAQRDRLPVSAEQRPVQTLVAR